MESEKIIHRVVKILKHYHISMNAFDVRLGLGNNYIGSMIRREGNIGSDVVEKIVRHFTEISPYWLITGEGEMLKGFYEENGLQDPPENYSVDHFESALLKYLEKPRVKEKIKNLLKDEEGEKSHR